jgi:glycosyltransferase involved in cell wall biosynthesis
MQVALLTHEPFDPPTGGGSAAAGYLVRELVGRGHAVTVYGPEVAASAEVEARFGVRLRGFTRWAMGRTTSFRTAKYVAYPMALERWVSAEWARGGRPDVVVGQHAISSVAAGRLGRRWGVPAVMNLLDCLTGFMETWPRWVMPRTLARALVRYELSLPVRQGAAAVLAVSDALRERIVARGYAADRVVSIYYGYDAAVFRPPAGVPEDSGGGVVVMHGSFDHHHLGAIARSAVMGVARGRPGVGFRMVGPRTPALERFVADVRREVPGVRFELAGLVPYTDIPRWLAGAAVGITPYEPSTGTHCAFVAKTVEYLAMGIPVVSSRLESAQRYYGGGDGVTFADGAGSGFAEAMMRWLDCPAVERRALVEPLRRRVEVELDWSVVSGRAVEVLERVVGERSGG